METTHLKHLSAHTLTITLFLAGLGLVQGQRAPDRPGLSNFDQRSNAPAPQSVSREASLTALHRADPRVKVHFDESLGGPIWVSSTESFLTGPAGEGAGISAATLAAVPAKLQHRATRTFLQEHHTLFGFGPEALDKAQTNRDFVTPHNGLRTVVWEQRVDDIPVFEGLLISHTTSRGELVSLSSHFVPDPEQAANAGTPNRRTLQSKPAITAPDAVAIAAVNLGEAVETAEVTAVADAAPGPERRQHFRAPELRGESETRLVWLPMSEQAMRLCWEVVLTSRARGEMFRVLVDAETSEVLLRHGLTAYLTDASYRVYTSDSPSPFSPGYSTPVTTQPALVSRTLVTLSALNTNASPNGWIDDGVNETIGNNVDAHTDKNGDDLPDLPRPHGSPFRVFDFSQDLTQAPSTYTNAAVVQLFYWNNFMHDKLYQLGFTEAAGNFQSNNFSRGGLGNDAVRADAQDGSGTDNANFSTPADGSPGRMQMYIFTGPTPDRDGDLDAEVVLHEYTHGLSNRRVGGGVGISALQPSGMGEGWSDFYGLSLLSEAGDDVNGVYAAGAYASYLLSGLTQNYYFGIRRYPYCTDMSKNPLTFKDIDPAQASTHTGVPRSSVIGTTANEVHNMGEVWCVTLWEARANLITKYGWATGNQLILQLVTDGMNLSPANPTFLQARDAILQADQVDNGGANRNLLWMAFAKRGMGFTATSPVSSTTTGVHEAFDVPDDLRISPGTGLTSSGLIGGPFSPSCQTYVLSNTGTNALNWGAYGVPSWASVLPAGGSLSPGASNSVNVCLTAAVNTLTAGTYTASVVFSNGVSGLASSRGISLSVSPPRVLFFSLDTDPGWGRQGEWAFGKPTGLGSTNYTDPTAGATGTNVFGINLNGNYSTTVGGPYYLTAGPFDFTGYAGMRLQFQRWLNSDYPPYVYETVEISTNGSTWIGLWTNGPSTISEASWTLVRYDISAYADNRSNVYVRWGHRVASGAIAYSGWNLDDVEFLGAPPQHLALELPTSATEGDGILTGNVTAFPAPTNSLVVMLASGDTTEAIVPASVTIAAGQSNASFAISIVNDAELDGPQTATITASSPGYSSGSGSLIVFDNETATVSVSAPAQANEGGGTFQCGVGVSAPPTANIQVALSCDSSLQVPPYTIIPAGQTSAVFYASVIDDRQINGDRAATITAHVPNWVDGTASLVVHDDETTNLTVLLPAYAREGNGILTNAGSVRISGTCATNLSVSLASDDLTELMVPLTVTIPAGQTNAYFNLVIVDDPDIDGAQTVTVTAATAGFSPGSRAMTIYDNESPPVPFNPSPADLGSNVIQTAGLAWSSGAVAGELITNDVYFGTSPTPGSAQLLGTTLGTNWTLPTLAPLTTYYWQVVARKAGTTPGPVWRFTTRGVDHFAWDAVASPQYVGQPFSATLTAKDAFGITVSNFVGQVALRGNGGGLGIAVGPTLLVQTSGSVTGSLHAALNNLGKPHDFVQTADLLSLNLSNYSTVILGMNGGSVTYAGMASLATAVNAGAKLLVFGGSSLSEYACGLNDFFIRVNTNSYGWSTVAGSPYFSVTAPGHPLAAGLPTTYNFSSIYATYYMARVTDSSATTVAANGDGFGCLVTKPVGQGTVVMFINAASDSYWTTPADANFLSTVVSNALVVSGGLSILLSPSLSGSFTNGTWTGAITALAPTTNLVLRADDGNGHTGLSNPFDVLLQNDLSVAMTDSPHPVSLGGNVTYTVVVANTGPVPAAGVTLTNLLPPGASFVSASSSQGTCANNGNIVNCDLGTIPAAASATVTIVATANQAGNLTNIATVYRADSDPFPDNNTATTVTPVLLPSISVNDLSVTEGGSGITNAIFVVTISPPVPQTMTVNYATANGTAFAPGDYQATNGTLTFATGQTTQTIVVAVNGDTAYELNETFAVNLSGATNANIIKSQGVATIVNDDPLPTVSIGDATMVEGNVGTKYAVFPVTLSAPSGVTASVYYTTVNGTAASGSDYLATNGTLTFISGATSNSIAVAVLGDIQIEGDEDFYVDLSSPSNAALAKREGVGTILNDDGLPGTVDHFVWGPLVSPQYVNEPFGAAITAVDAFNAPVASFNGTASLSGSMGAGQTTNNILGNLAYYSSSYSYYTCGYSFTPTNNLTVTHVRSYSGTKVSIWTDAGSLLASQTVSGSSGLWTETLLATPLQLTAGSTYRLGVYASSSYVYYSSTGPTTFPDGTLNTSYYYYGDVFPTTSTSIHWFFVDLRYTVGSSLPLAIAPAIAGPFTNGVWTGNLTVQASATNLVCRADDGNGHSGVSTPGLTVQLRNDLSVAMADSPHTLCVGANLTYSLLVSNTGPTTATGVTLTNWLPAGATFVSAIASQGTCANTGNLVTCDLGGLGAASTASVAIVVSANQAGNLTNRCTVYRAETDPWLANNTATTITPVVTYPSLSINDVSAREGNSGTTNLLFTVALWPSPVQPVTVNYATANGTATAPGDYLATNGVVSFAAGETNKSVAVLVNGNTVYGSTKTFYVNLSGAVNAAFSRSQSVGTIINDDPVPALSIGDATVVEGNLGTTAAVFTVTLSSPSSLTTTVSYTTASGTATSGSDFVAASGTLTLPPLTTSTNIAVTVLGDLLVEPDEDFYVDLASPINATLAKREGVGTILNDDGLPGQADHFVWSLLAVTQYVGEPFLGTIAALDAYNNPALVFNGSANLSGSVGGMLVTNTIIGNLGYYSSGSGTYTFGYSFTPNTNLTVTHVRSYSGTKVSIWTDAGVLLATQPVNGTIGSWTETPLTLPLQLAAGTSYRVAFYTGGGTYYYSTSGTNTFPYGNINQAYYTSGDAFPTTTLTTQWYLVDLRYTVGSSLPVPVTPVLTGPFSNGVWTGNLTIQSSATNLFLRADDGNGHAGASAPLTVLLRNDLSVAMVDSPRPVSLGANLTYTITVANTGPTLATGVTLTNPLPAGASFVSAVSSQGTCANNDNIFTCNLGTINAASNATVTLVVVANQPGYLTNRVAVYRAESDPAQANNAAAAVTLVTAPALSINDVSVLEGNSGTSIALFTVTLSPAAAQPVYVSFATTDGIAIAPSDYLNTTGALTFAPGEVSHTIAVTINGDTIGEPNETFFVNLFSATNALITRSQGLGTILNDDVAPAVYLRSSVGEPWASVANDTAMNRVFGTNNWQDLRFETVSTGSLFTAATTFMFMEGSDNNAIALETFLTINLTLIQNWVSNGGNLFLNAAPNQDNGMSFGFGVTLLYPDSTATAAATLPAHPIFNGPFTPTGTNWTGSSFGHATVSGAGLITLITNTSTGRIVLGEKTFGAGRVLFGGMTTDNYHTPQPQAAYLRANILAYASAGLGADLVLSGYCSPATLYVGQNLTQSLTISNCGPQAASNLSLVSLLPVGLSVISVTSSQGTWSHIANSYTFSLGALPPAANAQVSITATAMVAGSLTNFANVAAAELDPSLSNNAFASVTAVLPRPVLGCSVNGHYLTLSWIGPCTLQTSTNLDGPFLDLTGVPNPFVVDTTGAPRRFFRVYAK